MEGGVSMDDRLAMLWEGRCGAATAWMTMSTLLDASKIGLGILSIAGRAAAAVAELMD